MVYYACPQGGLVVTDLNDCLQLKTIILSAIKNQLLSSILSAPVVLKLSLIWLIVQKVFLDITEHNLHN